jgi:beta-lactamase regulating signal transducer with metallopeptidase domain
VSELLTRALYYLHVHLVFASLVWVAAWLVTSAPSGSATTKYWIWVATSLNFALPLAAGVDALWSSHLRWAAPLGVLGEAAARITRSPAAPVLGIVWLLGAIAMLGRVVLRVRRERREAPPATRGGAADSGPAFFTDGVPVRFEGGRGGPAVEGVFRPRVSLPEGIERLLSAPELNAVLVHEVTHAKRRDNLIRLLHEAGVCLLWFHPLVWLTGSRIALYRELSCDESVIRRDCGGDLVSALAKLAEPAEALLLEATAASFMSRRLARLGRAPRGLEGHGASALLALTFGAILLGAVLETVAHTACCFIGH